jgi:hypothetical protein
VISYDLDIDAYHAHDALSSSKIKTFLSDGPQRYYRQYVTREFQQEDTPALRFGRIFDDRLCLTHEQWDQRYLVKPANIDLRTKEGKAWKDATNGKEVLTADEWTLIGEMQAAIAENPVAQALLFGAKTQVSVRGPLPFCGVEAQTRPDFLQMDHSAPYTKGPAIIDLKTTDDLRNYEDKAINYGYHRQLAIGQMLLSAHGIDAEALLMVVEKKRYPRCVIYRMPEQALAKGAEEVLAAAKDIWRRRESGDWNEAQTQVIDLAVREWRMR